MRRNVNKLATLVMTGALAASMSFSAFATTVPGETGASNEGVVAGTSIDINKDVTADINTMAPVTNFGLTINAGTAGTDVKVKGADGKDQLYGTVYAGVLTKKDESKDAIKVTPATFTSTSQSVVDATNKTITYKGKFTIDVSNVKFDHAGVYVYDVEETTGTYAGMTYDVHDGTKNKYKMYVFVNNNTNNTALEVANVVFAKGDVKVGTITNDYGKTNGLVHDLKVVKKVTGNAADRTAKFTFKVTVTPGKDSSADEEYKLIIPGAGENGADKVEILTANNSHNISFDKVMDGTELHVYGLTTDDTIKIEEPEAGTNSYTTKYEITSDSTQNTTQAENLTSDGSITVNALADGATVTITNNRDNVTPTGVAMDVAPYALMVALAGGAAATFLRKKESFED